MKLGKKKNTPEKIKRVAILGTASSLLETPWNDKDLEIWACSPVLTHPPAQGKRIDKIYELHPMEYWNKVIELLNKQKCPIVMQKKVPQIPNSEEFPIKQIREKYGWYVGESYFTSTIAYMVAHAIYLEFTQIELYGVHMAAGEEYGSQRQAMEYWVGVANGKGIGVHIPKISDICHSPYLYGYEQESSMIAELRKRKVGLENGISELKKQKEKVETDLNMNIGALKDTEYLLRRHSRGA